MKNKKLTYIRFIIQLIFLYTFPAVFTSAFSGIKYIAGQMYAHKLVELTAFVTILIAVVIYTIIFGRFFCGYACSFGTLGDIMFAISSAIQKKIKKKLPRLKLTHIKKLEKLKYVILLMIILLCFFGKYEKIGAQSPWSIFAMLTAFKIQAEGKTIAIILFILILIGMCFKERFFCQFLCPMGAVFALLPTLPFSAISRDRTSCAPRCKACEKKCPVNYEIESDSTKSGECIQCAKCYTICPKNNIKYGSLKTEKAVIISVILKASAMLLILYLLS